MDINNLFMIGLRRPFDLPVVLSGFKLKLSTLIEGAVFIAIISALLDALMKLLIIPDVNVSETIRVSGFLLTINPISMVAFQLIIITAITLSILLFSNFSSQKISIEELGKNVLFLFLVSFVLNLFMVIFILVSYRVFFYLNLLKFVWFVWALSSVVATLYNYRSVVLTALMGVVTTFFMMGFLLMTFVLLLQFLLVGEVSDV